MAYELLAGKPPFEERSPQRTLVAHLTEKPRPISEIRADMPPALADVVTRCLEKDPAARPQTAAEISTALDAVSTGAFGSVSGGFFSEPPSIGAALGIYAAAFVIVALVA